MPDAVGNLRRSLGRGVSGHSQNPEQYPTVDHHRCNRIPPLGREGRAVCILLSDDRPCCYRED